MSLFNSSLSKEPSKLGGLVVKADPPSCFSGTIHLDESMEKAILVVA
jgi:hypothetical protein